MAASGNGTLGTALARRMLLLHGALVWQCLVAAAAAELALEIEILGPGASKADPVYGTTVQLRFKCSSGTGGGPAAAGCG